jgi:RHS repeat-associated protein
MPLSYLTAGIDRYDGTSTNTPVTLYHSTLWATQQGWPGDGTGNNTALERYTATWNKKLDTSTGLIEMGARPYDPTLGRFLTTDPIEGGSLNTYDYAGQDPINGYDLDGSMDIRPPLTGLVITSIGGNRAFREGFTAAKSGGSLVIFVHLKLPKLTEGFTIAKPRPTLVNDDGGLSDKAAKVVIAGTLAVGSNALAGSAINELTKHLQDAVEQVQKAEERPRPQKNRPQRRGRAG